MTKIVNCECGYVVRADDDERLIAETKQHIEQDHPDLAEHLTDDAVLAMAEEE
jgi:predicted small metal-binding protein